MFDWIKNAWRRFWLWWSFRKFIARGKQLDSVAILNGVSRRPGESDKRLRRRIKASFQTSPIGTLLSITDAVAQHIPGIPFRVDEPGAHTVRITFLARESDFDLAAIEAAIETVRPVWYRVIVEREDP